MFRYSRLASIAAVIAVAVSVCVAQVPPTAQAMTATPTSRVPTAPVQGFTPGNIIDDSVFFAKDTMDANTIQSFLNAKVSSCQAGYTCLKDFAQATTSRSADAMCAAYVGRSRETAAQIIANVAQACGINPQVLLVTLQKEQGLVTHTWPSDWRYTAAMGQGCPDTAACDQRYYGFFNQVYGAAWQFKRYANPAGTSQYFTWYAPGKTWGVRFHPNASCGSSPVLIANQATANLYYYTPYQPNAASLAAGYGEGDGCSSYGNRNFFNYFTSWFGSTRPGVGAAITDAYAKAGGASGSLGAAVGGQKCGLKDGGCYQEYRNGAIYWSFATGAQIIRGAIRSAWNAADFERGLGYPLAQEICGLKDGGCFQDFQNGVIYWSELTGAHPLRGAIRTVWSANDYERGLGYPLGGQRCGLVAGGCYQDFQNGAVYWSPSTGAHALRGEIRTAWNAADYERGLGYPTSGETCGLKDGGCYQNFQNGAVYSSAAGAFGIAGDIRRTWAASDFERGLGYPTTAQRCGLKDGGCYQEFQNGVIYWQSASGAHAITGEIRAAWARLDFERGLGYPTSDVRCGLKDGGCYQDFQKGLIHFTAATGAHATTGPILRAWAASDYERGKYGYPVADQVCQSGKCTQEFQGGVLP